MRNQDILLSLLASLAATGCKQIECGDGTIDRNGICEPGDGAPIDPAKCGEGTTLVADRCVPVYPPTECDPDTTEMHFDETTGLTMCVGTGTGGLPCPSAVGTKETICGQLYDFETNAKLEAANATGAVCDPGAPAADGPCALTIAVYDGSAFANNPSGATPVTVGDLKINDRGEFSLIDVETSMINPYVGLGVDDAGRPMGPDGYAITSAIAFSKDPGKAVRGVELWLVKPSTTAAWAAVPGGPSVATTGIYAGVFRAHAAGISDQYADQSGVTFTGPGTPNDFYFNAAETNRTNIDTAAMATGANGSGIITNIPTLMSVTASGGITDTANCKWESHLGVTLPYIVFIQLFRKEAQFGKTCTE